MAHPDSSPCRAADIDNERAGFALADMHQARTGMRVHKSGLLRSQPGGSWVYWDDLPKETCEALQARDDTKPDMSPNVRTVRFARELVEIGAAGRSHNTARSLPGSAR